MGPGEAVQQNDRLTHADSLTPTTDTYLLLAAFVDELTRCGVRDACTSPGSRCTPLVASLAGDERLRTHSHIDERCAGFFAVGLARASGRPVVVTCTSGTAAANLAPAVIEAHEARVPLIVLTADRPPELRDVGAGQTIDQLALYGNAVRWFVEVGTHEASEERLRWIRTLACRAVWTADGEPSGPVHLNWPLREPLVPDAPLPALPPGRSDRRPWVARTTAAAASQAMPELTPHGVVVAGSCSAELGAAAARFAARAEYPLLADPLSGARSGAAAIAHYDALLRAETSMPEADLILRVGELPTSKPLRAWLAGLQDARQVVIGDRSAWRDPAAVVEEIICADPCATLDALAPTSGDSDWLERWRTHDAIAAGAITEVLGADCSEPAVARALGESLPADTTLFVASSMPVRDVESFWPVRDDAPRVLANRGANGIDGTVSSAFGAAAASGAPVVLLIGDVALAHDIGGLLAASRLELALTIVLLNNNGGGIFDFLEVAALGDIYERHVATPHGLDFSHAADLYGIDHELPQSMDALRDALQRGIQSKRSTLIEVRTDRGANVELHRTVNAAVEAAVAGASPPGAAAAPGA